MNPSDQAISKARVRLQVLCDAMRRISWHTVSEMYVREYESILASLNECGVDVAGFELPASAIRGVDDGVRNCDREFFVMRLAGFVLHLSQQAPTVAGPDGDMSDRIFRALQPSDEEPPF